MKKIISAAAVMALALPAMADITVKVDPSIEQKDFSVEYGYISDMTKPAAERPAPNTAELQVKDGAFTIATMPDGNAQYVIPTGGREYIMLYTKPGDNLTVNLKSLSPLSYSITGSKLMEDIARLDTESSALISEYRKLMSSGNPDEAQIEKINESYNKIFTDYIKADADAEAVPYAIMHLEGQDFIDAYNAMTPAAKASSIAIFLEPQKEYVEKQLAAERHRAELMSGNVTAPNFTFENAEKKPVSLDQFRGKWVIIDFWGTWCPWCIKGFPALKEAYAQYKPKLEVVGVACNDKYEAWLAGIKKYDLPWVNVFNPEKGGGQILEDYAVQGFPTKVIVNPDGKIVNITAGEDPSFFDKLKELIK